jgi:hypothetical protein
MDEIINEIMPAKINMYNKNEMNEPQKTKIQTLIEICRIAKKPRYSYVPRSIPYMEYIIYYLLYFQFIARFPPSHYKTR